MTEKDLGTIIRKSKRGQKLTAAAKEQLQEAAERYWLLQSQRLLDAFYEAKGYPARDVKELTKWVLEIGPKAAKAIADGAQAKL